MPDFIITQAGRLDMFEICEYFDSETGESILGDRFATCAIHTFEKLAQTPGLGRPRKFKKWPEANLRSSRVEGFPNHLIF